MSSYTTEKAEIEIDIAMLETSQLVDRISTLITNPDVDMKTLEIAAESLATASRILTKIIAVKKDLGHS